MNLAGYQDVIAKDADTALKVNISWHFFFPAASTTPWQLDGVIKAMKQDGYKPDLIHACHNRTVVIDAHLGETENKQINVVQAHHLQIAKHEFLELVEERFDLFHEKRVNATT